MTINRNNIEAYVLDYLEGNLDPLLIADLMAFLAENPEFENYIPDYDNRISISDSRKYAQKNLLKKGFSDVASITRENFDEFCIAAAEGLLNEMNINRLSDYLALHPEKKHNMELYRQLKLIPDYTLIFNGKSTLKKPVPHIPKLRYLYYALGIAASFALLVMLVSKRPGNTAFTESIPIRDESAATGRQQVPAEIIIETTPQKQKRVSPDKAPASSMFASTLPVATDLPASQVKPQVPLPLDPIKTSNIIASAKNPPLAFQSLRNSFSKTHEKGTTREKSDPSDSYTEGLISALIDKVDFWKTAETAIRGFNYLTEASVAIDKTTDESGKLTGLLLSMDSYTISGNKIK
jgi:hypothetical protein